jgi:hypothetical protein
MVEALEYLYLQYLNYLLLALLLNLKFKHHYQEKLLDL